MNKLAQLEPSAVFEVFEAISTIPRESGNEKAISDYIVKLAVEKGLEVIQEPCYNVIIKKPGSVGKEDLTPVIIQGHLDMVCTKTDESTHNFLTDPIPLGHDGDWVFTEGTTLGADNGIAVAMALAIVFDPTAEHPPLELLFTVSEETGMDGASAVDGRHFKGKTLINLDAEMEGFVEASCAGGINCDFVMATERQTAVLDLGLEITFKGLKGGHSGIEIDKNRSNAIRLMARFLKALSGKHIFEIGKLSGGEKMNAIAKVAAVTLNIQSADKLAVLALLNLLVTAFKQEAELSDPDLTVAVKEVPASHTVWNHEKASRWIDLLLLVPNGVQTMSAGLPGLVESSNNMGVLIEDETSVKLINAVRSSVQTLKEEILARMYALGTLVGAEVTQYSDYPAWPFKAKSPIRDLIQSTYKDLTEQDMGIEAIHAGLECGLLIERLGDIDMVSFGPNLESVHTPQERLSIGSTKRVYELLVEVLKRYKA
jgi:dipeptidase D